MRFSLLQDAYEQLQREATNLAGGFGDLAQRASVYRQIFRDSQGNHAFPLIAAHGALWAGGQFRFGLRLGRWLAWQHPLSATLRNERLQQLDDFCNALRNINRQVCVDTHVQFHFTRRFRGNPDVSHFVPRDLLPALDRLHQACDQNRPLTELERREIFEAHFLHEQETIVGETLTRAAAEFDWPLARFIALKPRVRFAFLPPGATIAFRNFADKPERIRNGLRAFDIASQAGWGFVEQSLQEYGVLEASAFSQPDRHYSQLVSRVLGAAQNRRPLVSELAAAG